MSESNREAAPQRATVTIRHAVPEDAAALVSLIGRIDRESPFSLREGPETVGTPDEMAELIRAAARARNQAILLAEVDGTPVGHLFAQGGPFRRIAETVEVTLGVVAAASGRGIGTGLLQAVEQWARETGLHRLELTVLEDNAPAIALYRKRGFALEGRKPEAARIDGRFHTELMMGKLLT